MPYPDDLTPKQRAYKQEVENQNEAYFMQGGFERDSPDLDDLNAKDMLIIGVYTFMLIMAVLALYALLRWLF